MAIEMPRAMKSQAPALEAEVESAMIRSEFNNAVEALAARQLAWCLPANVCQAECDADEFTEATGWAVANVS